MSCFKPNLVKTFLDSETGVVRTNFLGPALSVINDFKPERDLGHASDLTTKGYYFGLVPCGKCPGCRMDYSRVWADRMLVELHDNAQAAVFLTLTYNSEHLPRSSKGVPTLSKRDCQLFWKRFRKAFPGKKIRYYLAGEYGPKTHRPHYHAIVYGISLADFKDLSFLRLNGLGQAYYTSPKLERIWSNGFIVLSEVSWHTCAYVSRYVLKKRGKIDKYVLATGAEPEFNVSSRKPGIGLLNAAEMVASGMHEFTFDGNDGVYKFSLNRAFYRSALNVDDSLGSMILELNMKRRDQSTDKLLSRLAITEKDFSGFLKDGAKKLDRSLAVFDDRLEGV